MKLTRPVNLIPHAANHYYQFNSCI